jgi:hypothetical protein
MKKHKRLTIWSSAIAFSTLCVLALAMGGFTQRTTKSQRVKDRALRIQNRTLSFDVIQNDEAIAAMQNTTIPDEGIQISLRNGYDKHITALALSVNGLTAVTDFVYNDVGQQGIPPHAIYTNKFGFALRSGGTHNTEQTFEITVLGVVFADHSGDGDARSIWPILNGRKRCKEEVTLILSLLNRTLHSRLGIDEAALDTLRDRISSIPIESAFWSGKEDALRRLDEKNDNLSLPQRIKKLRNIYERLLAKL